MVDELEGSFDIGDDFVRGFPSFFGQDFKGGRLEGMGAGAMGGDGGDDIESPDDFAGDEEGIDRDIGADHTGLSLSRFGCFVGVRGFAEESAEFGGGIDLFDELIGGFDSVNHFFTVKFGFSL